MKSRLLLALFLLLLSGAIYGQASDYPYLPYYGLKVRVGMSIQDLGRPEVTVQKVDEEYKKAIFESTFKDGLTIDTLAEQKDVIIRIILTKSTLSFSNGLRTGISKAELIKKFGKPTSSGTFLGRKYLSYEYAIEYHEVQLILNAIFDTSGTVEEIRLVTPGD